MRLEDLPIRARIVFPEAQTRSEEGGMFVYVNFAEPQLIGGEPVDHVLIAQMGEDWVVASTYSHVEGAIPNCHGPSSDEIERRIESISDEDVSAFGR